MGVNQTTKNWAGNWFKFIGGEQSLKIEFIGSPDNIFRIPYVVKDSNNNYSLYYFELDEFQRGEIIIPGFGSENTTVIIIPSIQSKKAGFFEPQPDVSFFWSASSTEEEKKEPVSNLLDKPISKMSEQELLDKIFDLELLISQLKNQIKKINGVVKQDDNSDTASNDKNISFGEINTHLSYGMKGNQVTILQEFFKNQGTDIYPEAIISGWFGPLTQQAVIRFQEKYKEDILAPWGIEKGTGYVGNTTLKKINNIIGSTMISKVSD